MRKGSGVPLKTLLGRISLPLMIIDAFGQIVWANRGAVEASGYSSSELMAGGLKDLCAPYEQGRFIFSNLAKIRETTEIDIDFQKKNGQFFMVNLSFSPYRQQDNLFLFLVLRDVTQRRVEEGKKREDEIRHRKLLEERNQLEEKLQRSRKLAAIGELSAGVAHEINNPLAVITEEAGWLQDLIQRPPLLQSKELAEFQDSLREIVQQAKRCKEITHNLLRLGRQLDVSITEWDLRELIEEVMAQKRKEAQTRDVEIVGEFEPRLPPLASDRILLRQVFLNFLNNALDAMPEGGKVIWKTGLLPPAKVQVQISDTGSGIAPENLSKIFDPFFTTKGPGKGTGLGLSLSHTILEKLGGSVSVESRPGRGTTFTIQLPQKEEKGA